MPGKFNSRPSSVKSNQKSIKLANQSINLGTTSKKVSEIESENDSKQLEIESEKSCDKKLS